MSFLCTILGTLKNPILLQISETRIVCTPPTFSLGLTQEQVLRVVRDVCVDDRVALCRKSKRQRTIPCSLFEDY